METAAQKLLESAVQRTLHAHAFSRSSSQASLVLTDLLSRYLILVTSSCARHAQHAGRNLPTVRDATLALNEFGVDIAELSEFCSTEGKELNRYALHSARRIEDLNEFRVILSEGMRQDHDDTITLGYARYTPSLTDVSDEESEYEDLGAEEHVSDEDHKMEDTTIESRSTSLGKKRASPRFTTPPLPLSPVSNSPISTRKRPRTSSWHPPEHIPDFLPPFPRATDTTPLPQEPVPKASQTMMIVEPPPIQTNDEPKKEKPSISLSHAMTSAAAPDYLVQVPYSQSSLSSIPEWHLPSPPTSPPLATRSARLPILQTEPSLFSAYHHILTHPPPAVPASSNLSRHKVALALVNQLQLVSRWDPADTLFSSVGPCSPRVLPIGPTYPVAIGDTPGSDTKGKTDSKEKEIKFPQTLPRPVSTLERLTPLVSQQSSRIPDLARRVLPPTILARTSRLTHPPVLYRGNKPLTYGNGVPAPWNANHASTGGEPTPGTPVNLKLKDASSNSKESPTKPVIPDARLYATWDYESKDFRVPLVPRTRGRMGSLQAGGSGVISLGINPRTKSSK